MNESPTIGSKPVQSVCAQCGSRLSSSGDTETLCVNCLLLTALGEEEVDEATRSHRFDQYELITGDDGTPVELGRGAMGVTYKAFDTNLRCEVALKVIHPRYLTDEASRARFLSEARAAAQLRHRNIASVFHLGSERGEYFYAMELVEGETVEARVRRKGPIDYATALDIALQITRALIATGSRQFVHRDVKPSNIMLCTEADGAIVAKLIDFGLVRGITEQFARASASLVRQFANPTNPSRRTAGGSDALVVPQARVGFIGTPDFASPEQFAGEKTDARSDIFSLGVTLWFMLTGKLPFDGTRDAIRRKRISGDTLPFDQLKGIPRTVTCLIKRMLEAAPAKRPQSPAALKEQLHKCVAAIDAAKQKQRRRFAYSALATAALIVAALGAYIFYNKPIPSAVRGNVPQKSISVLPFANLIGESDSVYVVDGIRAQIAARLAKIANLKVVSGGPTQRYQSTPKDPAQVAAELGVEDILEGSVEKQGEKFRIAFRLIDAKNNADLWTKSYERTFPEIIQVESEVARQTAGALGVNLTEPERQAINKIATSNPRAYEAYLKGRYVWLQRKMDGYRQAKEYFQQAIALDPNYAQAHAGLADAYQFLGAFILPDRKENYDKAKSAYKRALELDPNLAEAHATAGLVAMNYDWDWPLAERELRHAIALNPNEALFYDWYAEYLMAVGRASESIDNIQRAHELDPFSIIINSDVGKLLFLARLYDQAEAQLKEALRMDPDFFQAHFWLGAVYLMKHRFDEAIAEFKIGEVNGEEGMVAYAYGMAGKKTEAGQMLELTRKLIAQRGDWDKWPLICAYIGVGDKDRAIASLEQDCENHATTAVALKSIPLFDPLRSEPRFVDLMRRVHLTPGGSPASEVAPEKSIAVLPFENLSDEKEHTFFADGVQDDVLTKLAKVSDLKVISRTSVMRYRGKQDLREIGQALGVSHILEGTVRRSGGKVHINAQLVDARTNTHVWAEEYDRDLNEVFAIEAELAQAIAIRLGANVSARETLTMQEPPTRDLVAYDLYTRAKNLDLAATFGDKVRGDYLFQAADLLNQAIARDPSFFQAYCQLAQAHDRIYSRGYDHTPARLAMAEAAVQAASRLRPDAGETHLTRAQNLYHGHLDYNGALAELEVARQSLPNEARIFQLMGAVQRRQGRWKESTQNLEGAVELNPRDLETVRQIVLSYYFFRRYPEEASLLDRALAIEPNHVETKVVRALLDLAWKADTRPLHQVIDEIRARNPDSVKGIASEWLVCALVERDAAAAKDALMAGGDTPFDDIPTNRPFVEGLIARMTGDDEKAHTAFIAARAEHEKIVQAEPNFGPAWCVLGLIDAALGRKDEALREGHRAVELVPVEKDAVRGPAMIEYLAMIAAWAGDNDMASEQLAIAVRPPSDISYGELKLAPWWDPLRGDPRFEKIVASLAPK
jgi:eukaryotic-like serine/threonine-protein kinase